MRGRYAVFGLAVLLVFSVLAVGCSSAAAARTVAPSKPATESPAADAPDLTVGQAVFTANCEGCHKGGRSVKGKSADVIKNQVRSGGSETRIFSLVLEKAMPAFTTSQITDAQLDSLVAYVAQLK